MSAVFKDACQQEAGVESEAGTQTQALRDDMWLSMAAPQLLCQTAISVTFEPYFTKQNTRWLFDTHSRKIFFDTFTREGSP